MLFVIHFLSLSLFSLSSLNIVRYSVGCVRIRVVGYTAKNVARQESGETVFSYNEQRSGLASATTLICKGLSTLGKCKG